MTALAHLAADAPKDAPAHAFPVLNLDSVAGRLGDAPNCRQFLEVWRTWRGDRMLPTRAEALPESLGRLLGAISVLEAVAPDQVIIRLVASDLEDFTGRSRKGENWIEAAIPADRPLRRERIGWQVDVPCGSFSQMMVESESRLIAGAWFLMLPVAAQAGGPPRFFYAAGDVFRDIDEDVRPEQVRGKLARVFDYVDIGGGLPPIGRASSS